MKYREVTIWLIFLIRICRKLQLVRIGAVKITMATSVKLVTTRLFELHRQTQTEVINRLRSIVGGFNTDIAALDLS